MHEGKAAQHLRQIRFGRRPVAVQISLRGSDFASGPYSCAVPYLPSNGLNTGQSEVGLLAVLAVVLLEFVQVGAQQLADQEQMLLQTAPHQTAPSKLEICFCIASPQETSLTL